MYLNQTKAYDCCTSKKLVSNLSMKRHAYGGANIVLIAVPETCCFTLLLNSKNFFLDTKSAISNKSSVGIHILS